MPRKLPKSSSANAVALEPQKRDRVAAPLGKHRNNWNFLHAG